MPTAVQAARHYFLVQAVHPGLSCRFHTGNGHTRRAGPSQSPRRSLRALWTSPRQSCWWKTPRRSCALRPPSTSGRRPCRRQHRASSLACSRCFPQRASVGGTLELKKGDPGTGPSDGEGKPVPQRHASTPVACAAHLERRCMSECCIGARGKATPTHDRSLLKDGHAESSGLKRSRSALGQAKPGRCAGPDKDDVALGHVLVCVAGEEQVAPACSLHHLLQPWLIYG